MADHQTRVTGRVVDETTGHGLAGVGISDGLTVVSTDADGRYALTVDAGRRASALVSMTVPAGWQTRRGQFGAPDFYRRLDVSSAEAIAADDFHLRPDPRSAAEAYRFVVLADVHVAATGLNPTEMFTKQLGEIERFAAESDGGSPAFVAVAGDLTNDATADEFADYVAGTAASTIPVWSAPGNHDLAGRIRVGAYPAPWPDIAYRDTIERYRSAVGPEWYSFQFGRHHFVVLENYRGLGQRDQLTWLRRDLEQHARGKKVVVVSHVPWNVPQTPDPSESTPYLHLLSDYDVALLLAGHTHANDVSPNVVGGARQIVTTTLGASTLDGTPRGFRFVDVDGDQVEAPYWELETGREPTIVFPVGPVPWHPDMVRVARYTPPGVPADAEYQVAGSDWQPLKLTGRRTWTAPLDDRGRPRDDRELRVRVRDRGSSSWLEESVTYRVAGSAPVEPRQGTSWTMFRGDARRTGVSADAVGTDLALAWVGRSGGTILASSPAVAHGRVYIGVRDEDDAAANGVAAFDFSTGEREWFAPTGSAVEASVAVVEDLILAPAARGPLEALDASTGTPRWSWEPAAGWVWMYSSPLIHAEMVYVTYNVRAGAAAVGLEANSGDLCWHTREAVGRNWMTRAAPAIAGERLYFASAYANLVCADLRDGAICWQHALGAGLAVRTVPVIDGDLVLLACQGDQIVAVDRDSGAERWRYVSDGGSLLPGMGTAATPAVADGLAYAGFTDGRVTAIDVRTGGAVWHHQTGGPVLSSPVVSGDHVVVGSKDGTLRVLVRDSGECAWSYDLGNPILSTPVVSGNAIVVGAWDGNVYAFAAP
jgi:outer membrane protein assembly factor BamB